MHMENPTLNCELLQLSVTCSSRNTDINYSGSVSDEDVTFLVKVPQPLTSADPELVNQMHRDRREKKGTQSPSPRRTSCNQSALRNKTLLKTGQWQSAGAL